VGRRSKRDVIGFCGEPVLPEGFDAGGNCKLALAADVDNAALFDAVISIMPAESDVKDKIEDPERLAAFWWSPYDDQPLRGDQVPYEVGCAGARLDLVE